MATSMTVRVAAMADIHCSKTSQGAFQPLFNQVAQEADLLLLCGDLTDYGQPQEAHILAKEITTALRVPVVGVLGNHDFEAGKQDDVTQILCDAGVTMLNGDSAEICGVGFAGVRGFGGGFGRYALAAWGEDTVKRFVHEALDEALKLESALGRLRTPSRVAMLHYSPIRTTVEGEPEEIFAFLGSSRLEEPLLRYPVNAVFHGHAHHGTPEGKLRDGTPVYNVSLPLLRATTADQPPFRVIALPAAEHSGSSSAQPALA